MVVNTCSTVMTNTLNDAQKKRSFERYQSLQILMFTQLMNISEFARHIKKAFWTPHPSVSLIKEIFAETKRYCDHTTWPNHSIIKSYMVCDVYPAHFILQLRSLDMWTLSKLPEWRMPDLCENTNANAYILTQPAGS